MKMPRVSYCEVEECAYNRDQTCHALAITVGGGDDHMCDTFFEADTKGGDPDACACVGACRSTSCTHNQNLECKAPEINVGYESAEIDCKTYRRK